MADTRAVLGDSGITLGGTDEFGVRWVLLNESDLWQPKPAPREVSGDRTIGHGSWSATDYYGSRMQEFRIHAHAPSHAALHDAHDRLRSAVGLRDFRVLGYEPNHPTGRWSLMRQNGGIPWSEATPGGANGGALAVSSISLVADDPLIYSDEIQQVSTGASSTSGGLAWPTSWPATWNAAVTTGILRLTNEGYEATPIEWRVDGPAINPIVTETGTGRRWRLALSLAAGEWVVIDPANLSVLAQGDAQASRRPQFSGDWLYLPRGVREYAFAAEGTDENTRITATFRHAWI